LQDHSDWKKFRDGLPEYLDEMDIMFTGNTVDGTTAFCAGEPYSFVADAGSCDEEPIDDPEYQVTPPSTHTPRGTSPSTGGKRTSSTSTTATSPNKKARSPAVRVVDTNMQAHNDIQSAKINLMKNMLEFKKESRQASHAMIELVTQLAYEMGVSAKTPTLFRGLYRVIQSDAEMKFFLRLDPEERKALLQQAAGVDN
jgi:hypothetical protein